MMWKRYQSYLRARADGAAADPSYFRQFLAERRESAIWGLPIFPSLAIGWFFGLSGLPAVLVVFPSVALFVAGSFFYVPVVFSKARRRRTNDS